MSLQQRMMFSAIDPTSSFGDLPYDYYCPSVHKDGKLQKMVCKKWSVYFATQVAKRSHSCGADDDDFDEREDYGSNVQDNTQEDAGFSVIPNI